MKKINKICKYKAVSTHSLQMDSPRRSTVSSTCGHSLKYGAYHVFRIDEVVDVKEVGPPVLEAPVRFPHHYLFPSRPLTQQGKDEHVKCHHGQICWEHPVDYGGKIKGRSVSRVS